MTTDQTQQPRLVVGVGASAGGLEAFRQLLEVLPSDSGMAFLLVQHLDPTHKSMLADLLAPCTEMHVTDANHRLALVPDTVYIIQPDTALAVRNGRIEISEPRLHRGVRLPVDHLFRSLARDYGPRSAGIVLSGAGSDGSAGLRDIKAAGGLTVAQEPASSGQPGMPQSAIDTGVVDLVLDIPEFPATLERFASLPPRARVVPANETNDTDEIIDRLSSLEEADLGKLAALLQAQLDFDLRVYKAGTVERRVLRRMALSGFDEVDTYFDHLRQDPVEQQTLVRDLLISVTDFFRDPEAFRALREMVIDPLVAQAGPGTTLRAWVPGCATGEEAYSLGIEFLDSVVTHGKRLSLQLFATDIDQDALAFARAGHFPPSIVDRISTQRLRTYFKPLDDKGYQVRPPLRDIISFAVHDLTKDPPFSRMHLVSCRNVLIYLTSEAQKHVLKILHFALETDGHLLLSTSESTGPQRDLFSTLSKTHRIYKKVGPSRPIAVSRSRNRAAQHASVASPRALAPPRRPSGSDLARRAVLQAWVPPTVLVSDEGSVIFLHGELGPYLQFPQGDNPRLDLAAMLRPWLATRARGALYKCRRNHDVIVADSSPDGAEGSRVRITAKPAPELGDGAVMLTFEPAEDLNAETPEVSGPENPAQEATIDQLEKELEATREDLRNTVEELETSNEELRSTNEESMSMNEELQSANEELEATAEELRSLNEELTTVNSQLREKVEQLEQAHDDLHNFFASTKIATLFLDEQLCVKRFTPAARDLIGIDHADTGRHIRSIARDLLQNELEEEARTVLEHLTAISRDLESSDGRWITRQVLPYRTESRRIEGVVVTFTDITELRAANEALEQRSHRLELAWEAARGGIFEHRFGAGAATFHSDQYAQILGYRHDELPAHERFRPWLVERVHPDDLERFERTYQEFIDGHAKRYQVEVRLRHRGGHWLWVRRIAKALERDNGGQVLHMVGMMMDITDQKRVEESLRESESRFREMTDGLPLIVWVHDAQGQQEYVNETFCRFFGVDSETMQGGNWQMLLHPEDLEAYNEAFLTSVREQRPFHGEARVRHADGSWRWLESWGQPRRAASGEYLGMVGTSADVTERRRMEQALRDSEDRFRAMADHIAQLAWMANGDAQIEWYNQRWLDYTDTTPEQMKQAGWEALLHPEHRERVTSKIRACIAAGDTWEDTFPLCRHDGTYRWFLSRAIPIRNDAGDVARWFGTHTDVTEQREIAQQLVDADRQKDEFLAMLGHELRNPLAAIRSGAELLERIAEGDPQIERTQAILERQSAHMARLLDGLLDVSRIIRGKIEIEREAVDLTDVCRQALSDLKERVADQQLDIRIDIPPEPVPVLGDRVRLVQIVDNLLSNAAKFTSDGGNVQLSLTRRNNAATLEVHDDGVGMEPELIPHVFEVFRQAHQNLDRAAGGLGLGLALVKTLAELHGGSVTAESDGEGRGATFTVQLPLTDERPPSADKPPSNERPLRVLLIEDNHDAAEMLRQVLVLAGHEVEVASDGSEGTSLAADWLPDLVLCDLGLPGGMSGFDVATELRADEQTRDLRLVSLSGYGRPEDKERGARAGFDAHITKPVDLAELEDVLSELDEKRSEL